MLIEPDCQELRVGSTVYEDDHTTYCAEKTETHDVQCCSALDGDHATSVGFWKCGDTICGGRDDGGPDAECTHATYAEAEKYCADQNARLCTTSEVEADCGRGSGCQYDTSLVWTSSPSTACRVRGKGSSVYAGDSASSATYCDDQTAAHYVGCCANEELEHFEKKASTCDVYGSRYGCIGGKTYPEAEAYCESLGARLCTAAELAADCTREMGCNYDDEWMWSSSSWSSAVSTIGNQ